MPVSPRDVVKLWDRHTRPNKPKIHICVCERRQLFLRINSNPVYKPCHALSAAANTFLEWDSYVELTQLVRHIKYEIDRAEFMGRISQREIYGLLEAVWEAETLSDEHKSLIDERLR